MHTCGLRIFYYEHIVVVCSTLCVAFVAGALAYLVDIEGKNEFSRTEDNVYVARQLIPGTFYNVVVFSIGANQRQNSIGSESLRVQTG